MRANEHLAAAERHELAARERESWPVQTATVPGTGEPAPVAMPWYRTWDTSADHERLARQHRSHAATLQAAYDEACSDVPVARVRVSPLTSHGMGAWPTSTGAIVYLHSTAGSADQVMKHLRCHRSWMMLAPAPDMDECPLDLPGLLVDARGDSGGITLSLSVRDSKLVPELQRRVAKQLETSPTSND